MTQRPQPSTEPQVLLPGASLPKLLDSDVLVLGGGIGGVAAALHLARAGQRVALVERRSYLGWDLTATLHLWCAAEPLHSELIDRVLDTAVTTGPHHRTFHADRLKRRLEDLLDQAGVRFLFASPATQVLMSASQQVSGVVIANKGGRQVIGCQQVIDATRHGITAHLLALPFPEPHADTFSCVAEFYGAELQPDGGPTVLEMPESLDLVGNRVKLHPGYHKEQHTFAHFTYHAPTGGSRADQVQQDFMARERALALAAHLRRTHPAFTRGYLASIASELTQPAGPGAGRTEALKLAQGVWRLTSPLAEQTGSPDDAARQGEKLAALLLRADQAGFPAARSKPVAHPPSEPDPVPANPLIAQDARPTPRASVEQVTLPPQAVELWQDVDVLVVGGGSSGASAAIAAAQRGASTVVAEMQHGLGGTGTYGGIHTYWMGNRVGFAQRIAEQVADLHEELGLAPPSGEVPYWSIEAKAQALRRQAMAAGVAQLYRATFVGVLREGRHVLGAVFATPQGPVAVRARLTIDATGDGDVAVAAGADAGYGTERDHVTMWYALTQFPKPGRMAGSFTSSVDIGDPLDYTRAILAGRRRHPRPGKTDNAPTAEHAPYLAPRESRHVWGDVVLTLEQQLRRAAWPDTITVALSNHDVKGHTQSDWLRVGLIPPQYRIEIPLRAVLPRGLDNLLVVGKALSATAEGLPAIRMQADLENLGGAAGVVAAHAVRRGVAPRDVEMGAVQRELEDLGVLPLGLNRRTLRPLSYTRDELQRLVEHLPYDRPLHEYSAQPLNEAYLDAIPLVELCCAGPEAVPLIEAALPTANGAYQERLAIAAALVGSAAGAEVLAQALQRWLSAAELPARTADIAHTQLPPDQGAMPDAAYLLYALGLVPTEQAIPVWERVAELLSRASEQDLNDGRRGTFYYVDALCFGAEQLARPDLAPLLLKVARAPYLHGLQVGPSGAVQPDPVLERRAYLEIVVNRALARCGHPNGYRCLAGYVDDARALLARAAHTELVRLVGSDLGRQAAAWLAWTDANSRALTPQPLVRETDARRAWRTPIVHPSPEGRADLVTAGALVGEV